MLNWNMVFNTFLILLAPNVYTKQPSIALFVSVHATVMQIIGNKIS